MKPKPSPTTESKILQFPKSKIVREVPKEQELSRERRKTEKMADAMVEELTEILFTEMDNYFVDVEDQQFRKDFVLVHDSLKAAIYRQQGLEHHLHEFVDNNIRIIEGDIDTMTKEEIQEKIAEIVLELQEKAKDLDNPSE